MYVENNYTKIETASKFQNFVAPRTHVQRPLDFVCMW